DASSDETVAWLVDQGFEEKAQGEEQPAASEWLPAESESRRVDAEWQALQSRARTRNPGRAADIPASGARLSGEEAFDELPATQLGFLRNDKNCGFGETCNRGIAAAAFPLVFLLNNDVEVAAN